MKQRTICLSLAVIFLAGLIHVSTQPHQIIFNAKSNLNQDANSPFQTSFAIGSATVSSAIDFADQSEVQLDVPYVNQYNDLPESAKQIIMKSACGPASLAMSFKYLGIETNLMTVINKLPTSVYVKGVQFYDLPSGTKVYDKRAVLVEPTPTGIYEALKNRHPVILNVQNYNGILGHALLVTGIRGYDGKDAKSLIIHDPYVGPNREFTFITGRTLRQPEGFTNYIGTLRPFYVE
ncbi:MAG: C39 family peptidase [Patescibacteria group bacterium]|nr:C39 family peptidase [Patescibacteria group bacterium]